MNAPATRVSFRTVDASEPESIPDRMLQLARGMLDLVDGLESDARENYPPGHPMRVAMFQTAHGFKLNSAALTIAAEDMGCA